MEVLVSGTEAFQPTVLLILRCIFDSPGLDMGPSAHALADAQLFYPVAALLETPHSSKALEVQILRDVPLHIAWGVACLCALLIWPQKECPQIWTVTASVGHLPENMCVLTCECAKHKGLI